MKADGPHIVLESLGDATLLWGPDSFMSKLLAFQMSAGVSVFPIFAEARWFTRPGETVDAFVDRLARQRLARAVVHESTDAEPNEKTPTRETPKVLPPHYAEALQALREVRIYEARQ